MATFSQILHHNIEHPVQPWEPGERAETEKNRHQYSNFSFCLADILTGNVMLTQWRTLVQSIHHLRSFLTFNSKDDVAKPDVMQYLIPAYCLIQ